MPLIQNTKRINPLDVSKRTTIGVAFPLNEVNITTGTQTVNEQLKTNFLNLLLTVPGERIYNPNYGIGLKKLLFENYIDEESLFEDINNKIQFYLPEIKLNSVKTIRDTDLYKTTIKLDYNIIIDNTDDSIQINFS
jgi:phage baseplate assembly protein W